MAALFLATRGFSRGVIKSVSQERFFRRPGAGDWNVVYLGLLIDAFEGL
jgi:hypothetical protein